ncbi:hypothetical protein FAIPA1_140008 [Frankia sp. AiPs1]
MVPAADGSELGPALPGVIQQFAEQDGARAAAGAQGDREDVVRAVERVEDGCAVALALEGDHPGFVAFFDVVEHPQDDVHLAVVFHQRAAGDRGTEADFGVAVDQDRLADLRDGQHNAFEVDAVRLGGDLPLELCRAGRITQIRRVAQCVRRLAFQDCDRGLVSFRQRLLDLLDGQVDQDVGFEVHRRVLYGVRIVAAGRIGRPSPPV